MVREREIGPSTESHTQNPESAEIFDSGSLEGEKPFRRNKASRRRSKMTEYEEGFIVQNPDLSATELAEMLGRGRHTIGRYKDLAGVRRRPSGWPRKNIDLKLVVRLYSELGLRSPAISRYLGCSVGTIINRLRMGGVEIKSRGG